MTFGIALQESFICNNCHDILRSPLMLYCAETVAHNQCRSCVQSQIDLARMAAFKEQFLNHLSNTSTNIEIFVTCYKCQKQHTIDPLLGVDTFKTNTTLQETISEFLSKANKCEGIACNEPAVIECEKCEFRFCENCSKKVHSTANHGASIKKFGSVKTYRKCTKHERKKMDLFCIECEKELCSMCLLVHEKSHVAHPIYEVADDSKEDIESWVATLTEKMEEFENLKKDVLSVADDIRKQEESTCKIIMDESKKLKQVVRKRQEALIEQTKELASRKRKRC